ncbi:GLoBin related [Aphelenchoides besseyi]|nr:GLoBin related [Aphelenchoides besseyi]
MGNTKSVDNNDELTMKADSVSTEKLSGCADGSMKKSNNANNELKKKKNCEASKSTTSLEGKSKAPVLSSSQRQIVKYCLDNAKDDLGERILRRVGDKREREDFRTYFENLAAVERHELVEGLRLFIHRIVEVVTDLDELDSTSRNFGERHAHLRSVGFKPEFFGQIADSLATECTFLDGAAHSTAETLLAWSQLTSVVFSAVRDGYYGELRRLRRISNTSSTKETDEQPSPSEPQKEDSVANEDDRISSKSIESHQETGVHHLPQVKSEPSQFLAPPSF